MNLSAAGRQLETLASIALGPLLRATRDKKRISPDSMASLADLSVFGSRDKAPSLENLRNATVVFIAGHRLEDFYANYGDACRPKVVILGDGDRDWSNLDISAAPGARLILAQNLEQASSRWVQGMPIGIENRKYGKNGMPWLFSPPISGNRKERGVFFGPFGATHPIREKVLGIDTRGVPGVQRCDSRISSLEFAYRSSRVSHVLAPRGNGKDTHRFWETLYRGGVPVVTEDDWSKSFSNLGIPMEIIEDWTTDEIARVAANPAVSPVHPSSVPALWLEYWEKLIRDSI